MAARKNEVEKLKAEMEEMGRRLMELTGDTYEDLEDDALSFMGKSSDFMKEKWNRAKQASRRTGAQVQEYAEDNPWHMLAIGAALGFVAATLIKRNRD